MQLKKISYFPNWERLEFKNTMLLYATVAVRWQHTSFKEPSCKIRLRIQWKDMTQFLQYIEKNMRSVYCHDFFTKRDEIIFCFCFIWKKRQNCTTLVSVWIPKSSCCSTSFRQQHIVIIKNVQIEDWKKKSKNKSIGNRTWCSANTHTHTHSHPFSSIVLIIYIIYIYELYVRLVVPKDTWGWGRKQIQRRGFDTARSNSFDVSPVRTTGRETKQ